MKMFLTLKQDAVKFLEQYKTKGPATYAAAEQAVGALLITDGLFGIENPFGAKKRAGIFGAISGVVVGIIFMFVPTIFGNLTGIDSMTATTSATVVSVGQASRSGDSAATCLLTVQYSVNGQQYNTPSSLSSTENCSLISGQSVTIQYDPANPGAWAYGAKTVGTFLQVFFWAGVLALISSIITFFIRLLSIIFGWKLLKDGRKNAAALPPETNMQTMIDEIKKNFTASIFGFGGNQNASTPPNGK